MGTPNRMDIGLGVLVVATLTLACAGRPGGREASTLGDATEPIVLVAEWKAPLKSNRFEPSPRVDPMFACVVNSDCVVLEMGCCDHCNGGSLLSFNSAYTSVAIDRHHERFCDDDTCTERVCFDSITPICDKGMCARLEEHPMIDGENMRLLLPNGIEPDIR
jgi:hypothetical protein